MARHKYTAPEIAGMHKWTLDAVVSRVVIGRRVAMLFSPTTRWVHTGLVIERMLKRGMEISHFPGGACCYLMSPTKDSYRPFHVVRPNPCRAICEAAVLATQAWRAARRAGE